MNVSFPANCTTPGYFRDANENVCKICPAGQYNSVKWSTFCQNCPDGSSTRNPGASSASDCIRKFESELTQSTQSQVLMTL